MVSLNLSRDEAAARSALVTVDRYRVFLDLTGAQEEGATTFGTCVEIDFSCARPGEETFLDFLGESVDSVELNGRALDVSDVVRGQHIHLPDLQETNTVVVDAVGQYTRSGEGLHRFVDPADGSVYLYTQFEPADGCRLFANFEQPDLKASFEFSVDAPAEWVVRNNGAEIEREGTVRRFAPTKRISTYVTAVVAGPYFLAEDSHTVDTINGPLEVPLGLLCRASLAEYFDTDRLFETTKTSLDYFHKRFEYPYPFGKYDQAFVPEYNLGAMENPGLVTISEEYVFRSAATQKQYQSRANIVMHEMAHMWFGDLVTMQWWDDLWLKESFADYMGTAAQVDTGLFPNGWVTFANRRKLWAYTQDALPTTHPIVADIVDLDAAKQNFDGITYAKGASALKQLVAFVGEDDFYAASRAYFRENAWGNTTLDDFLNALEEASGRSMQAWSSAWLQTSGASTIAVSRAPDGVTLMQSGVDPATGQQVIRPHALAVGFYRDQDGQLVRQEAIDVELVGESETVSFPGIEEIDLVLPNDGDLTYAVLEFDEGSLATALGRLEDLDDEMARTLCWSALWSMVRNAKLPAAEFVRTFIRAGFAEGDDGVRAKLHEQALGAAENYSPLSVRAQLRDELVEALVEHVRADAQLTDARALCDAAVRGGDAREALEALLDRNGPLVELANNQDLRWSAIFALAARDEIDAERIDAELAADKSAAGAREALASRSAWPSAEVKTADWERATTDTSLSNDDLDAIARGWSAIDPETARRFVEPYFASIRDWWDARSIVMASQLVEAFYPPVRNAEPGGAVEEHPLVVRTRTWLSENDDAPAGLRRIIVEELDSVERALRGQAAV